MSWSLLSPSAIQILSGEYHGMRIFSVEEKTVTSRHSGWVKINSKEGLLGDSVTYQKFT